MTTSLHSNPLAAPEDAFLAHPTNWPFAASNSSPGVRALYRLPKPPPRPYSKLPNPDDLVPPHSIPSLPHPMYKFSLCHSTKLKSSYTPTESPLRALTPLLRNVPPRKPQLHNQRHLQTRPSSPTFRK